MFVVGLTGGIGSGKSAAAALFAALGVPVVDTDTIAHHLTATGSPLLARIAADFGRDILQIDGSLDRCALRARVFSDPTARVRLEALLHPEIRTAVARQLQENAAAPYQIVVIPLLFETGAYAAIIQRSVVVDCEETQQIERTSQRSRMTENEVRAIMAAQMGRAERLALADDVLDNQGSSEALHQQVEALHRDYLEMSAKMASG